MRDGLELEEVSLRLGSFRLGNVSLDVAQGEVLALLGPNGAGKSVTLETIAGFHHPPSGRVIIDGRDVTALPPERRRVGLVFQNFGLFPHLSVAANVACGFGFGSRARRAGREEVARLLTRFRIEALAERPPEALSPGEKQRTALARALAMQPAVFLFDEPFSALDARTRYSLRETLHAFLEESRIPAIFVTHEETDATVLADRVAIMNQGKIVQEGTVAGVFRAPVDSFVADFLGVENRLAGRIVELTGGRFRIAIGERVLSAEPASSLRTAARNVFLCIRGEDVMLRAAGPSIGRPDADEPPVNRMAARVVSVVRLGVLCKVVLDGGFPLVACLTQREACDLGLTPGAEATVEIEPRSIHLLAA